MGLKPVQSFVFLFACLTVFVSAKTVREVDNQKHVEVSLRMIGHQLMLRSGDSTSRILPIVKENNTYRIQFESHFEFTPGQLVSTIDQIVQETNLANSYIVEVEACENEEMVYSFKMEEGDQLDIVPCGVRGQPKGCYSLVFTLLDTKWASVELENPSTDSTKTSFSYNKLVYYLIIGGLVLLIGGWFYFTRKSKMQSKVDPNVLTMGTFQFDQRTTALLLENERIDLTQKEADLLLLLYSAANTTVEREVILNKVWGDEGDYVGRTLDVFISKLRKKLELDSTVNIVNIRGVGYKLVLED